MSYNFEFKKRYHKCLLKTHPVRKQITQYTPTLSNILFAFHYLAGTFSPTHFRFLIFIISSSVFWFLHQKRTASRNPFDFVFVISRLFQKWCSSGVVSTISRRETIDFTGFSGTFQDTAVTDE